MSRDFVRASNQALTINTPVVTTMPLTMACWFYPHDSDNFQVLMSLSDALDAPVADSYQLRLMGDQVNDPLWFMLNDTLTHTPYAATTSGISPNVWQHACAVAVATNDYRVFLNGGSKGTQTEVVTPSFATGYSVIGRLPANLLANYDGLITEAAVWNVALTDAEVASLAKGFSPLLIAPAGLVAYWPLVGRCSPEIDLVGGYGLTLVNAPVVDTHCPIRYPTRPKLGLGITPPPPPGVTVFQYKTASGGIWIDVPHSAYTGTYEGTFDVVYPEPAARGGDGRRCMAVGLPYLVMQSRLMTASGMDFWRAWFTAASSVNAEVWLRVRDPRAGSVISNWMPWTGWLARPQWGQLQVGSGSIDTLYFDVELAVHDVRVTT